MIVLFIILATIPVAAGMLLLRSRVNTYTIYDGDRVVVHTTRETKAESILKEAGIVREAQDTVSILGLCIQIERPQQISIDCGPEVTRQEEYTSVLYCKTLRFFDPMLPAGTEQVLTVGKNGELRCQAEVTYRDGREIFRKVLEAHVTLQPVDGVIAVGTGQGLRSPDIEAMPVAQNGILRLHTGEVLMYSKVITSLATAYCDKGKTATGTQARVGAIAVDPEYIPYGTRMFIVTMDGEYIYGIATAEDCGNKEFIHDTRIDLHLDTYAECRQFGARWCWVYILC